MLWDVLLKRASWIVWLTRRSKVLARQGWSAARHQTPLLRLRASLPELTLRILGQNILCTACPRGCFLLAAYGRELLPVYGLSRWGLWLAPVCSACGEKTPPRAWTRRAETLCGHTHGAPGPIVDSSPPRGQDVCHPGSDAQDSGPTRPHKARGRPWMPSEGHLGEDKRDRGSLHPRAVGAGDAGDPGERGPESKGGCVAVRAPRRGRRRG